MLKNIFLNIWTLRFIFLFCIATVFLFNIYVTILSVVLFIILMKLKYNNTSYCKVRKNSNFYKKPRKPYNCDFYDYYDDSDN